MAQLHPKAEVLATWHQNNQHFYDYIYENGLDYPCTSCQWGPIVSSNQQFSVQKVYYSCRTGNQFLPSENCWKGAPNYVAIGTVQLPTNDHYFIPELRAVFGNGDGKMFHSLKIRTIFNHPGEVTMLRAFPLNKKIFTTKNQSNQVFVWTNDKYKPLTSGSAHNPQVTLITNKSSQPNFALAFTPTLPRIATSSGNKIQVFDLQSATSRKELGSVSSNSLISPTISMDVGSSTNKQKIQDIAFKQKNNEICIAGGQGKKLGFWDLRLGKIINSFQQTFSGDIHSLSWKQNIILAGCSDGKLGIIDDRMLKTFLFEHQKDTQILSVHWNPDNKFFGVGSDNLYFYNYNDIEESKQFKPRFTHSGMRGSINDFDWNLQNPWNIISTCHEIDSGGSLHIFKPLDLFYLNEEQAQEKLRKVFQSMTPEEQSQYL